MQANPRPDDSADYFNFSHFTMGLNELLPGLESRLCPTDSRLRPDIRALENGQLDVASSEKERLEEKQREFRKPYKGKAESTWWKPRWFVPEGDGWRYTDKYWQRDFKDSPDIF